MKIEDIQVGDTYYYDNAFDPQAHGDKFTVVSINTDLPYWPVRVAFEKDPDTEIGLDAVEVSMFPLGTKLTLAELDHDYRDRLRKAVQKLEALAAKADGAKFTRLEGKIDGVKLALSYWEEMNR